MAKSEAMEQFLQSVAPGRKESMANGELRKLRCIDYPVGCGREVAPEEFELWDALTQAEARISGLCEGCQDEIFGCDDCDCCG